MENKQTLGTGGGHFSSAWAIGEKVQIDFFQSGKLTDCEIIAVRFSKSKVLYDVAVITKPAVVNPKISGNPENAISESDINTTSDEQWTIICEVDSALVKGIESRV